MSRVLYIAGAVGWALSGILVLAAALTGAEAVGMLTYAVLRGATVVCP